MTNKQLLEKFAPIIKLTRGEVYIPSEIESYIKHCRLIAKLPNGTRKILVEKNSLTVSDLSKNWNIPNGSVLFLELTQDQTIIKSFKIFQEVASWKHKKENKFTNTQGRLARVGFISRFFDAIYTLTFLLRGTVPGLASAQAARYFINDSKKNPDATIYGRVIKDNSGWIALQYWFFYYFNDWRSSFYGVNDHEGDWEMATVYIYKKNETYIPEWAAYASHDFHGDDLRRRYDDKSQLTTISNHPVIFAGAGSHASYFLSGEYLTNFPIPYPKILKKPFLYFSKFWSKYFDFGIDFRFTIPFIDYARGDGLSFGFKQKHKLNIIEISDKTEWVNNYKGLWGFFAQDPVSGEDAPAGPKYNRDKSIRSSWSDPLAFSGLDKIPTPPNKLNLINKQIKLTRKKISELTLNIKENKNELILLSIKKGSVANNTNSDTTISNLDLKINELKNSLKNDQLKFEEENTVLESLILEQTNIKKGLRDNPLLHVKNLAKPQNPKAIKHARLTEAWAAVSVSILIIILLLTFIFFPHHIVIAIIITLYIFALIESILRGTFINTIIWISLTLSFIALLILLFKFWIQLIIAILFLSALYLVLDNFREIRR